MGEAVHGDAYLHRRRRVTARRMTAEFMFETPLGWVQGKKGEWLVDLGDGLRIHLDNKAFEKAYRPAGKNG